MIAEVLRTVGRPIYEAITKPLTNRFYPGGWDQWRFDVTAGQLSRRYLPGDISLKEAYEIVDRINVSGRFPGRDMRQGFDKTNMEAAKRNAAPSVPDSWRRHPS